MTNPQFSHLVNHRPTLNQPSDIESERFPGPMSCKNLPGERRTTSNTMQIPQKCLVLAPNCCKGHGKFQGFDGNIYIYIFVDALNLFCVIPHPLDGDFPRAYSDQELLAPHRNQGGVVIRLHVGT